MNLDQEMPGRSRGGHCHKSKIKLQETPPSQATRLKKLLKRGEIYKVAKAADQDPKRRRCFVVVSRRTLLDSKAAHAVCAPINTEGHGLETEVPVGAEQGLKHTSYINCDLLIRIEKSKLTDHVGSLPGAKLRGLNTALRVALDLD